MTGHSENEKLIVSYLLGALPEAELAACERRYLEDATLFAELEEIEDELIDDYVSGALTGNSRERFEKYFLRSAARREKLEFARAITEHAVAWKKNRTADALPATIIDDSSSRAVTDSTRADPRVLPFKRWSMPVPAWQQWTAIAATILIAAVAGALWLRNRELRKELLAAEAGAARAREKADTEHAEVVAKETKLSETTDKLQQAQDLIEKLGQPGGILHVVFTLGRELVSSGSKGEGEKKIKTLVIPANARSVSVNVAFAKSDFLKFQATVRRVDKSATPEKNLVWTTGPNLRANTRSDQQSLQLKGIPATRLLPGNYELVVSGATPDGHTESVAHYYLKVIRH
jgi:hypothetical protein